MSLRDWFAGMALQGIMSSNEGQQKMGECAEKLNRDPSKVTAFAAYCLADDMLAERAKEPTP